MLALLLSNFNEKTLYLQATWLLEMNSVLLVQLMKVVPAIYTNYRYSVAGWPQQTDQEFDYEIPSTHKRRQRSNLIKLCG